MPQPSLRMCAVCRQRRDRATLVRLALLADGSLVMDRRSRLPGRGAWVCRSKACWEPVALRSGLARGFKARIEPDRVEALVQQMHDESVEGDSRRARRESGTASEDLGVAEDLTMR